MKNEISENIESNNNNNNNILKRNKYKSNNNSLFLKLKKKDSKNKFIIEDKKEEINKNNKNYNEIDNNIKTDDYIYENDNKNIINTHSNVENFGSLEKRFYEMPVKNITPGVGAYSLVKTQENNANKYKSNSPYRNINIKNLKKTNQIPCILKNNILFLNHKSPPVGLYSPEKSNCIEYDCQKKISNNNGKKIGFLNEEERFFQLDNLKNCSNYIGKYNIIKEEKQMEQQKAPFSTSEEKSKKINLLNYNNGNNNSDNLGPGAYRYDSYFDWIKKSYNKYFT